MNLSRRLLVAGVGVIAAGLVTVSALGSEPPRAVEHLETARSEGAKLQDRSAELRRGIREIAGNFGPAAGLSDVSGKIGKLTHAQQRSLRRVDSLLAAQVDDIGGTAAIVAEIRALNDQVAAASTRQATQLSENISTLRRLRAIARRTRAISTYFTRQAAYGARLAEDSARSFGP